MERVLGIVDELADGALAVWAQGDSGLPAPSAARVNAALAVLNRAYKDVVFACGEPVANEGWHAQGATEHEMEMLLQWTWAVKAGNAVLLVDVPHGVAQSLIDKGARQCQIYMSSDCGRMR